MKQNKNNNRNTQVENVAKKASGSYDEYACNFSFKKKPINPDFIRELAEKLRDWSLGDEAFRISDFYDREGIHPSDFYRWLKNYPNLTDAHDFAIRRIASRREIGAAKKQLDGNWIARTLGVYCPDFKSEQERLANLKAESIGEGIINLIVPDQKSTGRVKKKSGKVEEVQ